MTENETRKYINVLDDIVKSYNLRWHRMINMSPEQAEKEQNHFNVRLSQERYYHKIIEKSKKPKYKVGEYVRVAKSGNVFKRSYDEQFDTDFFIIEDIKRNLPRPMYILKSPLGVVQTDLYYEEELQPYRSDVWKIEEVLRRRRRNGRAQSLVKWLGFPLEEASWIDDTNLTEKFQRQGRGSRTRGRRQR